jgi:nucleolar complex protein 2
VAAFLRIRQAAAVLPFPFLEHCLKGAYLAYARSAKFMSESNLPGLTLMGNCLVELYGLDMTSSYQHAFVYLRQLALHLRAAYTKKTPEALHKARCGGG